MVGTIARREFVAGLAATAWPLATRAQQPNSLRRIGWLFGGAESDPEFPDYKAALRAELAKLGWKEGQNLRIDLRFGGNDPAHIHSSAVELVSLAPELIITGTGATTDGVRQQTQTIPILFIGGGDPVAAGRVRNIARPEGNTTGFSAAEPSIAGKWLELFKEAVPDVYRVAVIFISDLGGQSVNSSYLSSIETAASKVGVEAVKTPVRTFVDIVRFIDTFGVKPNGGMLLLPPPPTTAVRETILELATQHRLPTMFPTRADVTAGALMCYQRDLIDDYRRAASYVDRLLRGAKVSELPVQFPTKFELLINLKTAKAIGLTIPESFLLRADKVIE